MRQLVFAFPVLAFLLGCRGGTTEPADVTVVVPVQTAPSVGLVVPFKLVNGTGVPIRYGVSRDGVGLCALEGKLLRDGMPADIGPPVLIDYPPFRADQVRVLAPGEEAVVNYVLDYGTVKSGRYELRLDYFVGPGSVWHATFGLTPLHFERTLLLDVTLRGRSAASPPVAPPTIVIDRVIPVAPTPGPAG